MGYKMNVIFMGTPDFAVPSLRSLIANDYNVQAVLTQPDRPKGRKRVLTAPPVKMVAIDHDIPVFAPHRIKDSSELQQLLNLTPDFIITAAYGQMLPIKLLQLPKYTSLNVHASLLPKYRGGAPIHQAILDGEKQTGVSIMEMVEKLDAGDVFSQIEVPIEDEDDVGTMHDKLSHAGAKLLLQTIPLIATETAQRQKQDERFVSFASNISRQDEQIQWDRSARAIFNHVRGLRPFPGAFTRLDDQVIKIWRLAETGFQSSDEKAGTVVKLDDAGIWVAAGDGKCVAIQELQLAGKKRMDASSFIRGAGCNWKEGYILQ